MFPEWVAEQLHIRKEKENIPAMKAKCGFAKVVGRGQKTLQSPRRPSILAKHMLSAKQGRALPVPLISIMFHSVYFIFFWSSSAVAQWLRNQSAIFPRTSTTQSQSLMFIFIHCEAATWPCVGLCELSQLQACVLFAIAFLLTQRSHCDNSSKERLVAYRPTYLLTYWCKILQGSFSNIGPMPMGYRERGDPRKHRLDRGNHTQDSASIIGSFIIHITFVKHLVLQMGHHQANLNSDKVL